MTIALTPEEEQRAARPQIASTGPARAAGGFFRAVDGSGAASLGEASRTAAEDAVAAAVRMAYRVADAQALRSARLAERLTKGGNGAAGRSERKAAADGLERATFRTAIDAIAWLEGLAGMAAGPDGHLNRLIAAQRQLIVSCMGMSAAGGAAGSGSPKVRIFLKGEERRAVKLKACDVGGGAVTEAPVAFYPVGAAGAGRLDGVFACPSDGECRLTVTTSFAAPAGLWRAAVCREDGEQIGVIDIEL